MEKEIYKNYALDIVRNAEIKAGIKLEEPVKVLLVSILIVNSKYFYEKGLQDSNDIAKKKTIKCPMKIKKIFPYGEVPVVDTEKLKKLYSQSTSNGTR